MYGVIVLHGGQVEGAFVGKLCLTLTSYCIQFAIQCTYIMWKLWNMVKFEKFARIQKDVFSGLKDKCKNLMNFQSKSEALGFLLTH